LTTVISQEEKQAQAPVETRRQTSGLRGIDLLSAVGAAVSSLALTGLITTQLAPISGTIPFFVIAYLLFVGIYALIVSLDENGPAVRDRIIAVIVHSLAFMLLLTLVFVVAFTFVRGSVALPHSNFYTQDMTLAGPLDPLSDGGIIHAIAGTLIQITIALAITIPLGLTTALFLTEVPGPFARFVRTIVEAMTALPSIVAGLFIFATFILIFGIGKSGFAASLAISVMMLPIMIRASDVVIRLVPSTLKEASIGLGAGQWKTVWHVILPTSRSGLTTAIILASARGIGETSPVLLTAGFTASLNLNPFNGPMISLPLAVFEFVKSPEPTMVARGFGTAAVLMILVLLLFIIARLIGGQTLAVRERRRQRFASVAARLQVSTIRERFSFDWADRFRNRDTANTAFDQEIAAINERAIPMHSEEATMAIGAAPDLDVQSATTPEEQP
jgi:phosphate transport system permease protein